ncbi:SDR family NAD(P)-dependent oxidoreductase [Rhodococcus sp. T7]|uniref:SDR family NAD(P)-dependent oxidoreductase n=1 Tax=Rhodococcus sp. T7 TaxID=627444 RepID=UPI001358CC54|nr:SDR family oxidoreductase [Rhodococcus sp. T7]KAF0957546.1 putative oxidoreductase [Rhodococcus sp. T7]KAF0964456.1 putative oxidoreductase [Rhodococcus sp. T7]
MGILDDQSVVITGGGQGLGRSYALAAAASGAAVVVNDVNPEGAQAVVSEIVDRGGRAVAHVGSVADWDTAQALVELCVDEFGAVDAVVNNAAIMHMGNLLEDREEDYRRLVETNLLGTAFVGTHAARAMVRLGGGRIVNVTSTAHLGRARTSAYAATKGGVSSLTYGWAVDLAKHGVYVNAIAPSAQTPMLTENPIPGIDYTELPVPDEVAPLAVYLMSDRVRFTGQVLRLEKHDLKVMNLAAFPDNGVTRETWSPEDIDRALNEIVN